jgi:uncharacterized repeat protein (TIGR01451 family)
MLAGLVMVNNNSAGQHWVSTYPLGLALRIASRDPNELTINPSLLGSKPEQKINRKISYQVKFENMGAGIAKNITCTLSIPKGIVFPSRALDSNYVSCEIGGKKFKMSPHHSQSIQTRSATTVIYHYLPAKRQIIFSMKNINLAGTIEGAANAAKTEGLIRFQLKTAPTVNQVENCMYSYLSIKFDNNEPVTCEPALLRGSKDTTIVCSPLSVFDPRPATR